MSVSIKLSRTGCLGPCPIYTMTIHSAGKVFWEGEMFVKVVGKAEWDLTKEKISAIEKIIDEFKYFEISKGQSGNGRVTCMPSCITSVELKSGRYKTIDHYHGDDAWPKELTKFEDKIDRIAGTKKYIGKATDWMQ